MSRNIGGNDNDISYRYKMPKLITKVEGRGNGIKTRIVNMYEVGKAIHRDPAYVTKFFGCELGAQSKISEKTLEYIVNGNHDTKTFEALLDVFVEKYVLCPNCKLPETDLSVTRQSIYSSCNACGHRAMLDSAHRIAQYIIKCPPKEKDRVKVKASKQQQKAKEDEELVTKAQALKIKDSDAWVEGSAPAAPEEDSTEPVDVLRRALNEPDPDVQEVVKLVKSLQSQHKFGNIERTKLIFAASFSDDILRELKPRAEFLKAMTQDPRLQRTFLACLEKFLESKGKDSTLMNKLLSILQGLFDYKIIPDNLLLEFLKAPKAKNIDPTFHTAFIQSAKPFVDYLESEEEDEEEDETEEEVPAPVTPTVSAPVAANSDSDDEDKPKSAFSKFKVVESDSDSDVDLDDL